MRVLIAEDDLTSRSILTAMLKKWGYDPVVTEDGGTAWSILQRPDSPKLLLLDWDMPGMDGLEICRRLKQLNSSDPPYVILLTGRREKEDIVQGLNAGANDYVAKPYNNEELQARIRVGQRMLELQSNLVKARDALAYQAMHDSMTGVLNRRAILDTLEKEILRAKRENGRLSIGMCDIDHFKRINDGYGHQAGDEVLVAFTRCIQSNLRKYDSIGRFGGEEFLVVTPGSAVQGEESPYERLRARVADTAINIKTGTVFITVSIGVAEGTGSSTVDALLAAADAALYQAKNNGRNRVAYANPLTGG
jgi:two-component system cell cycle response regulator